MAVCIMKQIVIADALLEIDKVRKICVEKSEPDRKWQNLLVFTSQYIHDIVSGNVLLCFWEHDCRNIDVLRFCDRKRNRTHISVACTALF